MDFDLYYLFLSQREYLLSDRRSWFEHQVPAKEKMRLTAAQFQTTSGRSTYPRRRGSPRHRRAHRPPRTGRRSRRDTRPGHGRVPLAAHHRRPADRQPERDERSDPCEPEAEYARRAGPRLPRAEQRAQQHVVTDEPGRACNDNSHVFVIGTQAPLGTPRHLSSPRLCPWRIAHRCRPAASRRR